MSAEDILNEREKTHGDFGQYSELRTLIADALVEFMCKHKIKRAKLNDVQLTAINSIISKMCRIFCGDPNFADHWDDIAGYARLGKGASSKMEHMQEEKPILEEGGPYHKDCERCHHDIKCPCQKHFKEYCDHPLCKREYSAVSEVKDNARTTNYFWICAECDHQHIHDIKQENIQEEIPCEHHCIEAWSAVQIDALWTIKDDAIKGVFRTCKNCNWIEKLI